METSVHHQPSQSRKQVSLFRPYCAASPGSGRLGDAMAMFSRGQFLGTRRIQDDQPIPFSLRWQPGQLPMDPCPCTLTIDPVPGACYRFSVPSYQTVLWLLEVDRSGAGPSTAQQVADMPQRFWTRLFSA